MSTEESDLLLLGHVTGVHGIKGWIKIYSNTAARETIVQISPWQIEQDGVLQTVAVKGKKQGKLIVAHIKGCDDRNAAMGYIGAKIYINKSQLPELDAGDYYWSDLEGLKVVSQQGVELGQVHHLIETGANDVLVVQGDKERLIPFVMGNIVKNINLDSGVIEVDWQSDY